VSNNSKTINEANEKTGYTIKNDGDRTRAGLLGAVIYGLIVGGIAIYIFPKAKREEERLIYTGAVVLASIGIFGGFLLGECIYDNLSEK
nr:hypothetical protein [Candidatus Goldiibacteriota bacterium]